MRWLWIILALFTAPAPAEPCAGDRLAPDGVAVAVRDGTLSLSDGRQVRLSGLRLETGAEAEIMALIGRAPLQLRGFSPQADRYGRLRAQAFANGLWLQLALLSRGLARVEIMPDRYECAGDLYAAEATARAARTGIWSKPAFAIRSPETVGADIGRFAVVEGRVVDGDRKNGRVFLNFGPDWRTDFTVTIAPTDMKAFRARGFDPLRLLGSRIRVRGMVQSYRGPEIEIAVPEQIEVVGER
jgi:micrococcal nuclease